MRAVRAILGRTTLVMVLGLATTVLLAWALAAWLPHRNLTKRFNLVGTPRQYVSVFELSRAGMVRRAWRAGYIVPQGGPQLWTKLSQDATVALRLKTTVHDRSWGNLPAALEHLTPQANGAEDARGWPFLCLWCTLDESVIEGGSGGMPVRGGYPLTRIKSS